MDFYGKTLQLSLAKRLFALLGQTKLIIRFPFPPACFLQIPQNFHYNYGNLHRMDFQTLTKFSLLYWWGFLSYFLKILVIMNNEKWPPSRILFWKPWNWNLANNQLCLALRRNSPEGHHLYWLNTMEPISLPPSLSTGRATIVPLLICNLREKIFRKFLGFWHRYHLFILFI